MCLNMKIINVNMRADVCKMESKSGVWISVMKIELYSSEI